MTTPVCRKHWVALPADMIVVAEEDGGSISVGQRSTCPTVATGRTVLTQDGGMASAGQAKSYWWWREPEPPAAPANRSGFLRARWRGQVNSLRGSSASLAPTA